jgi:hypothetical protein
MKRELLTLAAVLVVSSGVIAQPTIAPPAGGANPPANPNPAGDKPQPMPLEVSVKVLEVVGNVRFRIAPDAPWQKLTQESVVPLTSEFQTGMHASTKLQVGPNSEITLKGVGTLTIGQVEVQPQDQTIKTRLGQKYGRMQVEVQHVGEFRNDYQIATPGTVLAVRGSGGEYSQYGDEWNIDWQHGNAEQQNNNNKNYFQGGDQGNNNNPNPQDNQDNKTNFNNNSNPGPPGFEKLSNPNDGYKGPNTNQNQDQQNGSNTNESNTMQLENRVEQDNPGPPDPNDNRDF